MGYRLYRQMRSTSASKKGVGLKNTKRYNLVARWLPRQRRTVRQRGAEFQLEELAYQKAETLQDPETGEDFLSVAEGPMSGLNKLLEGLETMMGKNTLDKGCEFRTQVYLQLAWQPGESISDFASRFDMATADLKADGVKVWTRSLAGCSRRSFAWAHFANSCWRLLSRVPKAV